jgi:hypothetical protein
MPSEARYRDLIATLRETKKAYDGAGDEKARLAAAVRAQQAVILYLLGDVEVAEGYLTAPLAALENAAFDAGRGATVALLEHTPERSGKPTRTTRENIQGELAFALELLIAGKVGTDLAARWVAAEARKWNVAAEDGSPIDAKQVKNWRTDIRRRKAPAEACETFDNMRHLPHVAPLLMGIPIADKRERCEYLARAIIKANAAGAPRSAPKTMRPR